MARGEAGNSAWMESLLSPLPTWIEDRCLHYGWIIVVINVVGTGFGFWYYRFQLEATPIGLWPWIPDSPLATLLMAVSLALYKVGRPNEVVNMLAFYGNIKLGLWTPYTLVLFRGEFGHDPAMYTFLFASHLLMVGQAFLIHRYSAFSPWAIVVALAWYSVDLVLDYFVPVVGRPHHTWIPVPRGTEIVLNATALDGIAAGATLLTLWITVFAFLSHVYRPDR